MLNEMIKLKLVTLSSMGNVIDNKSYEFDEAKKLEADIDTFESVWAAGEKWRLLVFTQDGWAIIDEMTNNN